MISTTTSSSLPATSAANSNVSRKSLELARELLGSVSKLQSADNFIDSSLSLISVCNVEARLGDMSGMYLESLSATIDSAARAVRHAINKTRIVNRMPPEILAAIFALVPELEPVVQLGNVPPTSFGSQQILQLNDLHSITQTCRRWREVALGTPGLWSTITIRQDSCQMPYLHRCTAGPLNVHLSLYGPLPNPIIATLHDLSSRIRDLYVSASPDAMQALTSAAMPELLHCRLVLYRTSEAVTAIPECPKLRTLVLELTNFLPSNMFLALTRLLIYVPIFIFHHDRGPYFSLGELLACLSRCPNLDTLYLVDVASGQSSCALTGWKRGDVVRLDRLKRLAINDTLPNDLQRREKSTAYRLEFLAHLAIPLFCAVGVGILPPSQVEQCTNHLGFRSGATRLRICVNMGGTVRLCAFNPNDGHYVSMDVNNTLGLQDLSTALAASPSFRTLEGLWIGPGMDMCFYTGTNSILHHLPLLQTLILFRTTQGPLDALEAHEGVALACPLLTTLKVECQTRKDEEHLFALSRARATADHPITRLIIARTLDEDPGHWIRVYDEDLNERKAGDPFSDGVWHEWRGQLSEVCLDRAEEPHWRSWQWDLR